MHRHRSVGYGQFQLGHFRAGEMFGRSDGSLGCVCPQPVQGCHVLVCIDFGTRRSRKTWLEANTLVHAVSSEQARLLEERSALPKGVSS